MWKTNENKAKIDFTRRITEQKLNKGGHLEVGKVLKRVI